VVKTINTRLGRLGSCSGLADLISFNADNVRLVLQYNRVNRIVGNSGKRKLTLRVLQSSDTSTLETYYSNFIARQ